MADSVIKGVSCPACGGSLEIGEGMVTLKCKYCGVSLLVRGERGIRRFQQSRDAGEEDSIESARRWMGGMDKARDLRKRAEFDKPFLVYLPFWRVTGKVVGWILGDKVRRKTVRRGNRTEVRTERVPVERMLMRDYIWTDAACDVSEFGVQSVEMPKDDFLAYDRERLQGEGMVFEPTESMTEAVDQAREKMRKWARDQADVDEVSFEKLNVVDIRTSIVYYPLWVLRYEYKGRTYQMLTDGSSGELLYGRAPGSTLFRAAALVGTMFAGNFVLTSVIRWDIDSRAILVIVGLCALFMFIGFWKFRYGAEVKKGGGTKSPISSAELRELRKFAGF